MMLLFPISVSLYKLLLIDFIFDSTGSKYLFPIFINLLDKGSDGFFIIIVAICLRYFRASTFFALVDSVRSIRAFMTLSYRYYVLVKPLTKLDLLFDFDLNYIDWGDWWTMLEN